MLDDRYAIVLVGLSKKQIADLPKNIKGLQRTNSQTELAAIYTAADVLVNPSVEETYGMTQVEAKACGTPSIVYKDTACEEIANTTGNAIVEQNAEAIAHQVQGGWKMVCIPKTKNQQELAEIYTTSDVFLNLTYEDNYPTVNLEAQACGTPCVTYRTGGSPESVPPENVVDVGDLDAVYQLLLN